MPDPHIERLGLTEEQYQRRLAAKKAQHDAEMLLAMANATPGISNTEALQAALGEYLKQSSAYYQRTPRQETPGGAYFYGMGDEVGAEKGKPDGDGKYRWQRTTEYGKDEWDEYIKAFRDDPSFRQQYKQEWRDADPRNPDSHYRESMPPRRDPVVMQRLRDLKAMRDGTEYEGERENAQSAMDRIMAKHGIDATEI